jgi:tetratricopeptide (TPR) repeat protein
LDPDEKVARDASFLRMTISLGRAALESGRIDVAAAIFKQALLVDAHSAEAVAGQAAVEFERANYTEALSLARRSVRLGDRTVDNLVVLGSASMRTGRYADALRAYERARMLDENRDGLAALVEHAREMVR